MNGRKSKILVAWRVSKLVIDCHFLTINGNQELAMEGMEILIGISRQPALPALSRHPSANSAAIVGINQGVVRFADRKPNLQMLADFNSSLAGNLQRQFAFCSAISPFYSAILKFNDN